MNQTDRKINELVTQFQSILGNRRVCCSLRESGELLGISSDTVRRAVDSGILKTTKPKHGKKTRRLVFLTDLASYALGISA